MCEMTTNLLICNDYLNFLLFIFYFGSSIYVICYQLRFHLKVFQNHVILY